MPTWPQAQGYPRWIYLHKQKLALCFSTTRCLQIFTRQAFNDFQLQFARLTTLPQATICWNVKMYTNDWVCVLLTRQDLKNLWCLPSYESPTYNVNVMPHNCWTVEPFTQKAEMLRKTNTRLKIACVFWMYKMHRHFTCANLNCKCRKNCLCWPLANLKEV